MTPALPPSTPHHVRAAILEAKRRLEDVYGDRLARVVLYGSRARGDARPDSDVDLLVVLHGEYQPYTEIRRVGALRLDISMRHEVELSLQPYSAVEIEGDAAEGFLYSVAEDAVVL